ncbi:hypothetical protein KVR01_010886 [Diaporthe batatas]|uniref:uncharacterized protein n=1 Tax=Diaporthe batatas TaxID=748121 RepID=UPI001D044EDE|nr:uncharacterized protein KVR01_010886 [Diaporthe batatas]KAG8159225.1 hypothetical protein KVR01_010886 [Diaporthe batatas]
MGSVGTDLVNTMTSLPDVVENAVTALYRHDCANAGNYGPECPPRWSKFASHEDDQAHLRNAIQSDPIIHRHCFNKDDKKWVTESFTVQDPLMRNHLRVALANYQDFDLELKNWTFKEPFSPIVHRWDRLNTLRENTTEDKSKKAIDQLMNFLGPILAPSIGSLLQTKATGKVDFENVWQIFPPGELAVTSFFGIQAVTRILRYELIRPRCDPPYWQVEFEYLDWNGERCGYTSAKSKIRYFDGMKFVTSLGVYPLSFSPSASEIKQRITARGRKFESLRGYHFRTCVGTKILLETKCPEERPVAGRVIIDAFAYYTSNNIVKPNLRSLEGTVVAEVVTDASESDAEDNDEEQDDFRSTTSSDDSEDSLSELTAVKPSGGSLKRTEIIEPLTDEQCLLASPWLKGLDLKSKDWAQFNVDELDEIVWNDSAFDHLVLPGNEKELAWAFVENKALSKNQFDDFIPDKGRGIIILMFGPPGVGKTYTAEAVAEKSRVPLYAMSAGTLGTKPKQIEAALERALELCRLWNAMLLLDEADVFLSARTDTDLARNELVAVFLTKLEYYQGICFLTTNRISSLDHAFQSRVDLFLPYRDLKPEARRQVWENFINRAGDKQFDVDSAGLDELSNIQLNGREIKNLIKSAHLLTLKGGEKITKDRLKMLAENRINALDALSE